VNQSPIAVETNTMTNDYHVLIIGRNTYVFIINIYNERVHNTHKITINSPTIIHAILFVLPFHLFATPRSMSIRKISNNFLTFNLN